MSEKVVLILVDGMRPDGMLKCGHPFVKELMEKSSYSLTAKTVFPSVTLPCHMSLFHSVDPDRHGVTTNTYTPQVRPIDGLYEQLHRAKKLTAMYYTWQELRDLARPNHVHVGALINLHKYTKSDCRITEAFLRDLPEYQPEFTFLYLGETDETGHKFGWMGEEYEKAIYNAFDCIERVWRSLPDDYTMIVQADHGGHDRSHGTRMDEDMTIPVLICGKHFAPGKDLGEISIKDIAPTVAALLDTPCADEWEGKSLLPKGECYGATCV